MCRWQQVGRLLGRVNCAPPKWLVVPILPELREIPDATPSGHLTYLVTKFGKPFSVAGLGNGFRDQYDAAGIRIVQLTALGRYEATYAAEATEHQLMGMFGRTIPSKLRHTRGRHVN
jgi:hypothetical protein